MITIRTLSHQLTVLPVTITSTLLWTLTPMAAERPIDDTVNAVLAGGGSSYRLLAAETYGAPGHLGQFRFFKAVGNKQTPFHYVPGDPRRGGFTDIAFISDSAEGITTSGLTAAQTSAAIRRAMSTWEAVRCSTIPLTDLGDAPNLGVLQWILGFGPQPPVLADITHAGWPPAAFFDAIEPGGSTSILASTFFFIWVDANGNPTDINNDHKLDTAFTEIYYNDNFQWALNSDVDVQTVALHESGHGLSQEHFGSAFITPKNLKIHFAPRTVMNSGYSGVQQVLTGTDLAGHCSIWASWPRR